MEAAATTRRSSDRSVGQLWQLPLLVVSLALFGVAGWMFIKPNFKSAPEVTLDQYFERATAAMKAGRPEQALEQFQKMRDTGKLTGDLDAKVHLLQGESIEQMQKARKIREPVNYAQIIDHTKAALAGGIKPDVAIHTRLAESYDALGRTADALQQYGKAIAGGGAEASPALLRKVIDLQLGKGDAAAADKSLDEYLKEPKLAEAERVWAVGQKSKILVDEKKYAEANKLLDSVDLTNATPLARGQMNYRRGYCDWKLGNYVNAANLLRAARNDLKNDDLDADAAYLLGRMAQNDKNPAEAAAFYQGVVVNHPGSVVAPAARLQRGVCRILAGGDQVGGGIEDLTAMAKEVVDRPRPALKQDAIDAIQASEDELLRQDRPDEVKELLTTELLLLPDPPAKFFERSIQVYEKLADRAAKSAAAAATPTERELLAVKSRQYRSRAGDAADGQSKKLTVSDVQASDTALWRAIDLYDQAGDLEKLIDGLERFTKDRPDDGRTPDGLLRLGRAYQVAGQFDKAIAAFQRNQIRYPNSLASSRSGVPLAQAYVSKGPATYSKAEQALQSTLQSPLLTPAAEDFKDALLELAQLYYRQGRYEEAVGRLEEIQTRYPSDARIGQVLFLMGDSYRKSAALLKQGKGVTPTTQPAAAVRQPIANGVIPPPTASVTPGVTDIEAANQLAARAEADAARRDRLGRARKLFERVIDHYQVTPPASDLEKLHLRLSWFYRADCAFDAGAYDESIRLYDAAALHYQDDPSALSAYVQIVNAYAALGKPEEAKAANERARWLLKRIPPDAFKDGAIPMPREYWDNWLKWSSEAGMW